MKRQVHSDQKNRSMQIFTNFLQGTIRWVRLLGSPRAINHLAPEASWITNSRTEAMQRGVTPPIIVRYTFRVRLCPTAASSFTSKSRN